MGASASPRGNGCAHLWHVGHSARFVGLIHKGQPPLGWLWGLENIHELDIDSAVVAVAESDTDPVAAVVGRSTDMSDHLQRRHLNLVQPDRSQPNAYGHDELHRLAADFGTGGRTSAQRLPLLRRSAVERRTHAYALDPTVFGQRVQLSCDQLEDSLTGSSDDERSAALLLHLQQLPLPDDDISADAEAASDNTAADVAAVAPAADGPLWQEAAAVVVAAAALVAAVCLMVAVVGHQLQHKLAGSSTQLAQRRPYPSVRH